jgi:hypothetical protein
MREDVFRTVPLYREWKKDTYNLMEITTVWQIDLLTSIVNPTTLCGNKDHLSIEPRVAESSFVVY